MCFWLSNVTCRVVRLAAALVTSYLVKASHQILHRAASLAALRGHGRHRQRGLEVGVALALSVWAAQISSEETQVVQWEDLHRDKKQAGPRLKWIPSPMPTFRTASVTTDPLVELLLLLGEDAGDLLWELDQVSHFHQLLADAADAGRE